MYHFYNGHFHPVVNPRKTLWFPRNGFNPRFPFRVSLRVSFRRQVQEKLDLKRDIRETQLENEGQVKMLVQVGGIQLPVEPQGQPFFNGCLVISNHFLYKDLESSN